MRTNTTTTIYIPFRSPAAAGEHGTMTPFPHMQDAALSIGEGEGMGTDEREVDHSEFIRHLIDYHNARRMVEWGTGSKRGFEPVAYMDDEEVFARDAVGDEKANVLFVEDVETVDDIGDHLDSLWSRIDNDEYGDDDSDPIEGGAWRGVF